MKKTCYWLLAIFILMSCVTQRKIEFLQDKDVTNKDFKNAEFSDYMVKPNDELFIQISSLDESASTIFANSNQLMYGNMTPYAASLISYTVDKSGYLKFPVIGKIYVLDKSINQISEILENALSNVLNQPIITVKLVNKFVTVLGEVRNPGHYSYAQDKLTVYDALGLAGDVTEYAKRNQIILLRNESGISHRINLDLTKSKVIASDYYFLRPNDILYVKPMSNKFWGMRQFPFAIVLSALTTAVLILTYVKN